MQGGRASDCCEIQNESRVSERKCVCPLLMDVSALCVAECV